jgi:hypothetical protein
MATPESDGMASLADKVNTVADALDRMNTSGQNQLQITYKAHGVSPLLAAALAVMFCTLFFQLLFAIWVIPILHDLQAWKDIHQNHISALEAKQK